MQTSSTQQFIDIAGIQEGVVILKNGGYRIIFSVSAVNFSLKSEEEQNSLIFSYQSFLNSLHFPLQIIMRSKRLDLNPYIKKINAAKDKQTSELIKMQTEDYVDFISQLINLANIMKKTFYVVVPYDPVSVQGPSILGKFFKKSAETTDLKVAAPTFKRYKDELTERANTIASGLGSMGLHCVQLTTEEIIELFYGIYNPGVADKERFTNAEDLTSSFVADQKEKPEDTEEESKKAEKKEEEVIDNSGIVEEQHKQEVQMKQMAADNEGERQIVSKEQAETPKPVETVPAPLKTPPIPATAPTNNINNDLRPSAPPAPPTTPTPPATPPPPPAE